MKKLSTYVVLICLIPTLSFAEDTLGSHFIENWDLNNNGSVLLEEITERRGDVFFMFDQDENEVITAEEYALFDETRAADMEITRAATGRAVAVCKKG